MRALLFLLFITSIGFSQNFKYGKVSMEELEETAHPISTDADAAILYRNQETRFEYTENEGFYIITKIHERIKIYNKDGYDWANKTIPVYRSSSTRENLTGLKGVTYNIVGGKIDETKLRKDGEFKEEVSKSLTLEKFTMPDIKDGSVVEYEYTVTSPFWSNINDIRLQETIPVNKVEVQFNAPEYFGYRTHVRGRLKFNIDQQQIDRTMRYRATYQSSKSGTNNSYSSVTEEVKFVEKIYKIDLNNVPPITKEAYSGNLDNYTSSLKFELALTNFPGSGVKPLAGTWTDVTKSIYDSDNFGKELEKSRIFKGDLDKVLQGAVSEVEKTGAIFNFVKAKMTWNGYIGMYTDEGIRSAYKNGTGNSADINLMLISMLREAGLAANPVLISTKKNGIPLYPTTSGFNYVVAAVDIDGSLVLLDATKKNAQPNLLEEELLNWQGRLVNENGASTWVALYPSKPAAQNSIISMNLNEDLSISGNAKNRFTGHRAMPMRNEINKTSEEKNIEMVEAMYSNTEISNLELKDEKEYSKPLSLSYDFSTNTAAEDVGGKILLNPLAHFATKENPFKSNERQYPIEYNYARSNRFIVTIDLPEGYTVESMPESMSMSLPEDMGKYTYRLSSVGNKLQLMVDFSIDSAVIPQSYYPDLKKFYTLMVEKETEHVVLVKA